MTKRSHSEQRMHRWSSFFSNGRGNLEGYFLHQLARDASLAAPEVAYLLENRVT
jgi:hypothetical protein